MELEHPDVTEIRKTGYPKVDVLDRINKRIAWSYYEDERTAIDDEEREDDGDY